MNEIYGVGIYRLHLFQLDGNSCHRVWSGISPSERNMFLLQNENSFKYPNNLGKLIGQKYFCGNCLDTSRFKTSHRCFLNCRSCGTSLLICSPSGENYSKQCETCQIFFLSPQCYARHKAILNNGGKRCNLIRMCVQCNRLYNIKNLPPGEVR